MSITVNSSAWADEGEFNTSKGTKQTLLSNTKLIAIILTEKNTFYENDP